MQNQKITELLKIKKRTISAEIIPPRNGTETDALFKSIETLKQSQIDFISVTKGAGGSLRAGTLPIAQLIQSQFHIPSVAHFTCRDYSPEEIENNLIDHHYFAIKNILALRGDAPDGQPDYFTKHPRRHQYAWQLIEQIKNMNEGKYLIRDNFDSASNQNYRSGQKTDFCIGAAAHPDEENGAEYFVKKIACGAEFGITQMIYNADTYASFLERIAAQKTDVPILPGFRILTQYSTAERMIKKFGAKIPQKFLDQLKDSKSPEDARKIGLDFSIQLCDEFSKAGAKGIHVFVMSDVGSARELFKALR